MDAESQHVISLAAVRKALSYQRLQAYTALGDTDELEAVARYLWNGALATAMVPVLHALEVTLRNNLYDASLKIIDQDRLSFRQVHCWLDAEPSQLYQNEERAVQKAKALLRKGKKPLTPGRLISKLGFGFWVSLCRRPYEQGRATGPGLWPAIIPNAFPFLPRDHRSRPAILQRLGELRDLRNRVFHHEPIWDRDLSRSHRRLIHTLGWMNQGMAEALGRLSQLDAVSDSGLDAYRTIARRMVRK